MNVSLHEPYALSAEQIEFFRSHGYIKLKDVLSPELLDTYGREISQEVRRLNTMHLPLEERNTYSRAFLQVINIWTHSEVVKQFVFSKRLARIAAELLGCDGVRLYHDQALYKEPSGGFTPWHVDQVYWPLSSEKTVTAWIPLQETPLEMGALCFAAHSHHYEEHRNLTISDESERIIQEAMETGNYEYVEEPFDLGEVSFHYGYTYHRAGPNCSAAPREVMTVIYMDKETKVASSHECESDWISFCDSIPDGELCAGPLNPVLYENTAS